jgi:hypothetical protein
MIDGASMVNSIDAYNSIFSSSSKSSDPFSNLNTANANLTAAIAANNPSAIKLALQSNFNDMLTELMATSSDDENEEETDYFSFLQTNSSQPDLAVQAAIAAQNGINIDKLF